MSTQYEKKIAMSPRTARNLKQNQCYLLISHGERQENLFLEDEDFHFYLNLIRKYKVRFHILVFGFCLMPKFVYLVAKNGQYSRLSSFMHGLNQSYAIYFNTKYQSTGKLFKDRYKSLTIKTPTEVLQLIQSVELTPVRLKVTCSAGEYPWSSSAYRMLGDVSGLLDQFYFVRDVLDTSPFRFLMETSSGTKSESESPQERPL